MVLKKCMERLLFNNIYVLLLWMDKMVKERKGVGEKMKCYDKMSMIKIARKRKDTIIIQEIQLKYLISKTILAT